MLVLFLALTACHRDAPDTDVDSDVIDSDVDTSPVVYDDDLGTTCPVRSTPLSRSLTPVRTFPFLPTSNGYVSAQYAIDAEAVPVLFTDGRSGTVDQHHALVAFTDHLAKNPTATSSTRDLLWDSYFGVKVDDAAPIWLNTLPEAFAGYVPGTGIVQVTWHVSADVDVLMDVFAPFDPGATNDLVVTAEVLVHNAPHAVSLYALANAHTGGEGHADGEAVSDVGGAIVEQRGNDVLLHTPISAPSHRAAAPAGDARNPWQRVSSGQSLGGELVSGDDVAVGWEWDLGTFQAGNSATRGFVLSHGSSPSAVHEHVTSWLAGRSEASLFNDELNGWTAWHAADVVPSALSADERALYTQSLAVLRMAQVREDGPGKGQILASLPPGQWNMAWPRDGAYATTALVHSGHQAEAREFLRFVVNAHAGDYASWLGLDDYLVSACRYRGDGTEESDTTSCPGTGIDAGANLELDDFGLFLWAFGEYARRWPDDPFVAQALPAVLSGVADPLMALIDPRNDLLVADSSIWERHWHVCFPNGRKQFAYSSIQAVAGLRAAAELSGDSKYTDAADRLRTGLLGIAAAGGPVTFYDDPAGNSCPLLASAPEEVCVGCGPYDASVIDAIDQGVLHPQSSLAIGTLQALSSALQTADGSPGFRRNDDGTGSSNPYPWYDDQEWVFVDLRMATAFATVGRATGDATTTANAGVLLDWVTAEGLANNGLIPELLSDGTYTGDDDADHFHTGADPGGDAQGAVPMAGFGAGAYVLAVEAIRE